MHIIIQKEEEKGGSAMNDLDKFFLVLWDPDVIKFLLPSS